MGIVGPRIGVRASFCNRRRRARETRVFGVAGIGEGEIAQDEDGAVGRFDAARMKTTGTEASIQGVMRLLPCIRHENKDSAVCGHGDC